MISYVKLGIATLLPVGLSALLYVLDKKTDFSKLDNKLKQLIYGICFGILAIIGTEWGIPINGAQVNCRDAAVLTAGLLFGAPAGVIAGVIGAVERYIAVAWGVGSFTRIACSVSTLIAGVYSALLRKFMFEDKKPFFLISFAIGVVMEVFHLTMVFITNMSMPEQAMAVVKACTVPMLVANGFSVMLSAMILTFLSGEFTKKQQTQARISQTIQRWLLATVIIAFALTSTFVFSLQDKIATSQTDSLLDIAIKEIEKDVDDIVADGGDLSLQIGTVSRNRHVGKTGYVLVYDGAGGIVSTPTDVSAENLQCELNGFDESQYNVTCSGKVNAEDVYFMYRQVNGYYVVAVFPKDEALQMRNIALYVNTFMEILVFAILFALVYLLIKKVVVNRIKSINDSLAKITGGDLGVVVDVRSNAEFASLSDDINMTVDTLKKYIDEASARIDKELEFAKNIQSSALPSVFPAFPKRKDFDVYALMDPAKEVGGDFYDFYITHRDYFNFVIADVSGKGIPAAMFMMRAKTELKSLTETDLHLEDVFNNGNNALCEGNDAGMFVTALQGGIDLTTGVGRFVNAGHNPPLVKHADGKFEYLRIKAGIVLACMDGVKYHEHDFELEQGDVIFLYTDGVTEATNSSNELYGEERLLQAINSREFENVTEMCKFIKADVDAFVGEAPQFDDITMLAFKYLGSQRYPSITFDKATANDIPSLTEFVENELEKVDCPVKTVMQINIAIDEIYSNIIKYGYPDTTGPVTVSVKIKENPKSVSLRFIDEGVPYNPLTKTDPDVTLSADERQIGGLGIYMVKKTMDELKYKYEDGKNVLTVRKFIKE